MYCEYCGKKLNNNETCDCAESMANHKEETPLKSNNMKISKPVMLIVAAVLVVAVVVGMVLSLGKEKINLADYLNTEPVITGLDGNGTFFVSDLFDHSALEKDLVAKISTKDAEDVEDMSDEELEALLTESVEAYSECTQAIEDIEISIWINGEEAQELTGLSNGDKIKVKASSNNPDNEYLKVIFKEGTVEFTIEGLTEGRPVAAFENADLKVSFKGTNGSGVVILDYDADAMPDVHVDFVVKDNTYSYSNGDQVEVVVRYDSEEWEQKGLYPLEESRTYTVEGLASYVSSLNDISDKQMEEMKTSCESLIRQYAKDKWDDDTSIENISFVGNCLLKEKEGVDFYGPDNMLYMIFKVDAFENYSPYGGDDAHISYYTFCLYEGLLTDKQGEVELEDINQSLCMRTFDRQIKTSSNAWLGTSYVYYNGYETLEELLQENIEAFEDKYSCESTVKTAE